MSSRFKRQPSPPASESSHKPAGGKGSFSSRFASRSGMPPSDDLAVENPAPGSEEQDLPASGGIWGLWKVLDPHTVSDDALSDEQKVGSWRLTTCPKCHAHHPSASTLWVHQEGAFWCGSCGFHGHGHIAPARYKRSWTMVWRDFLQDDHHLRTPPAALQQYGSMEENQGCMAPFWDGQSWVSAWHAWCLNDQVTIEDAFVLHPTSAQWHRIEFTNPYPFGWSAIQANRVVLVDHLEDMLVLNKAGVADVACLPPGLSPDLPNASVWRVLETMEGKLKSMTEIVLALRSDHHSRKLEEELGRRMDRERCFRVRWRAAHEETGAEDIGPIPAFSEYGAETLALMVNTAPPFPVVGVYELEDLEDRFDQLYETGLLPGAETGWPLLDQYYTVKTGQWTAVTGIPGHGKSSWLDGLLVNLATLHGWRFGLFSPENQPVERHFASLMEKKLRKPFSEGKTERISREEKNKTKRWLNEHFKVILPDEENGLWTLDAVLNLAKLLVYRYGIRGLVIDPWNELDHSRSNGVSETSHISESLTKVRRFARLYDVHVWIVAHPTKLEKRADGKYPVATPYDISGGAHWRNKADNALSIYRNVDEEDSDVCDIYVQKIRFREVGRLGVASLRCDTVSGAYIDDINQERRAYALSQGQYLPSSSMRLASPRQYHHGAALDFEHRDVF